MPTLFRSRMCDMVVLATLVLSVTASLVCAEKPQERMFKIVFRDATPGILRNSFAAKPKTIYQVGLLYQRVEEVPNRATGIHALIVSNNRDTWMANLANKTGQHVVDNAESYDVYAPVFDADFQGFNFGFEIKYMLDAGVKPTPVRLGERDLLQYERSIGHEQIRLMVNRETNVPYAAGRFTKGRLTRLIRYVEYKTGIEPDLTLFEKPSDIAYAEADTRTLQ